MITPANTQIPIRPRKKEGFSTIVPFGRMTLIILMGVRRITEAKEIKRLNFL